jgi:D-arabinose 1-dehydrogenase-like Zn-dependent alcohol dehydrogenase
MSGLLNLAMKAHGGLERWKQVRNMQAKVTLTCRPGDFVNCANVKICGISYDGGYQEYMVAPVEAFAQMTESLDPAEAAPLTCADVTTFNSLYAF